MGKNEEKEYIKRTIKSHKGKMNAAILLSGDTDRRRVYSRTYRRNAEAYK